MSAEERISALERQHEQNRVTFAEGLAHLDVKLEAIRRRLSALGRTIEAMAVLRRSADRATGPRVERPSD